MKTVIETKWYSLLFVMVTEEPARRGAVRTESRTSILVSHLFCDTSKRVLRPMRSLKEPGVCLALLDEFCNGVEYFASQVEYARGALWNSFARTRHRCPIS